MKETKKRKKGISRVLSIFMAMVLCLSTILGMPGLGLQVKAESFTLYINASADGSASNQCVTETTDKLSTEGWSYDAENNILTLSGFNGSYIQADGDLQIVLSGQNTININESTTSDMVGIDIGLNFLTIDMSSTTDKLTIRTASAFTETNRLIRPIRSLGTTINGGTVDIQLESEKSPIYGENIDINNSAVLNMSFISSTGQISADGKITANTSGNVNVNFQSNSTVTLPDLNNQGTGAVTMIAPPQTDWTPSFGLEIAEDAGPVTIQGTIRISYSDTEQMIADIPGNRVIEGINGYYWQATGYSHRMDLLDSTGTPITNASFVKDTSVGIRSGKSTVSLTNLKVGEEYYSNEYSTNGISLPGLLSGGTKPYQFALKNGSSLPEGLSINASTGQISGTPTQSCPAGSATIVVTDSSTPPQSVEIVCNYDAVADAPHAMKVGGTEFTDQDNVAFNGTWGYDKTTKTLTLGGYNGGPIEAVDVKDLTIALSGNNVITIPEETDSDMYGINVSNPVKITAANPTDILKIVTADGFNDTTKLVKASRNSIVVDGGTLDVKFRAARASLYGNSITVKNNASLIMDYKSDNGNVTGDGKIVANTSGNVTVIMDCPWDMYLPDLDALGSGTVSMTAPVQNNLNSSLVLTIAENAGPVTINGTIRLSNWDTLEMIKEIPGNRIVQGVSGYYWQGIGNASKLELMDSTGTPITSATFVKDTSAPLKTGKSTVTLTNLKIGQAPADCFTTTGFALAAYVSGGKKPYTFTLKSGSSLPAGLSLDAEDGTITGTPTELSAAGSATIVVTDSSTQPQSLEITCNYEAVGVTKAVTGVTLAPSSTTIQEGEEATLTATVLPEDASVTGVSFTSNSESVASVVSNSLSTSANVTTCKVKGYTPGKTVITVKTTQGAITASSNITVVEATPNAEVGTDNTGLYLSNLKASQNYSVQGTVYTSDITGKITGLPSSLLGTTIQVIKVNTDSDLNSAAQSIDLANVKYEMNSTRVPVSDTSKTYNGSEQEPTFGGTLTKNTDYTVSYAVKTGASGSLGTNSKPLGVGTYVVTVTGKGIYQGNFTTEMTINKISGPAAPTGLGKKDVSAAGASDGKITGVTPAMEYATNSTFSNAKACTSNVITGLKAGTYFIRVAETATVAHGSYTTISIADGPNGLTGTVSIQGTQAYGSTLTASVYNTNNTGTFSYQWKRGTNAITNATQSTYKVTADDVGKILTCVVTSSVENGSISNTTEEIAKAEGPGQPSSIQTVDTSMKGKADGKITGVTTAMEYATKEDFSDAKACSGTSITGLKAGFYYIRVKETNTTKAGSGFVAYVKDGPNALSGTVEVKGTFKYGETLTADISSTNNSGTLKYQWKRGNTAIKNATSTSYKLVKEDIGQYITCVVTSSVEKGSFSGKTATQIFKADGPSAPTTIGSQSTSIKGASDGKITGVTTAMEYATKADFSDKKTCTSTSITGLKAGTYYVRIAETDVRYASNSKPITVADGAAKLTGTAAISGSLKYGQKLTATLVSTNNSGKLYYQWKRNDKEISDATSYSYVLTKDDVGCIISCDISSNVEQGIITAKTSVKVAKADGPDKPTGLKKVTPSKKGAADGKITGVTTAMEYATKSDFSDKKTCTSTSITGLKAGTYYVRIAETATTKAGTYAEVTLSDGKEDLSGKVTITGTLKFGQTLTAKVSDSNASKFTYQWKRGTTAIKDATKATYKVVKEDIGQELTCEVTDAEDKTLGTISGKTSSKIVKADGPAKPDGLGRVAPTKKGASDGKITGVTTAMEYATMADFSDKKTCTSTSITGLKAGTYYIRIAETATTKAGSYETIVLKDGMEYLNGKVTITGTLKFGQTLTANVSDGNASKYTYQWKRGTTTIKDATKATYEAVKADIGQILTCEVTDAEGKKEGTISGKTSDKIAKADGPDKPTGLKTTAASKQGASDGKITGVTTAMEYATKADFSDKKACTSTSITGLKAGTYYVRIAETATTKAGAYTPVTVKDGKATLSGKVTITGTLKFGQTLTAKVSDSNASKFTYQWKRGTTAIKDATKSTYKTVKADIGQALTCEVADAEGKTLGTISGKTSDKIAKADGPDKPTGLKTTAASKQGASDGKITGVTTAMEYATKKDFSDKKACTSTSITGLKAGTYYVRVAETATTKAGAYTQVTVKDGKATLSGKVTITGTLKFGQTLTAKVSDSNASKFTYQWKRGTTAIKDATKSTYKTVKADIGQVLTCEVTDAEGKTLGTLSGKTSAKIAKADGPAAPSDLKAVAPSKKGASDGKITGVTTAMEYATKADFSDKNTCTATSVTGLKAGTYYVRVAETDTTNPGAITKVEVKEVKKDDKDPEKDDVVAHFDDINTGDWYVGAVQFVYNYGIMNGVSETSFGPKVVLTREQFITVLYNMEGAPKLEFKQIFDDVKNESNAWYAIPVTWAAENNITSGIGNNLFGTGKEITREQLATLLYNYAQQKDEYKLTIDESLVTNYPDAGQISDWAGTGMKWAVTNGVMGGKAGKDGQNILDPQGKASRAECAQMIKNLKEKAVK